MCHVKELEVDVTFVLSLRFVDTPLYASLPPPPLSLFSVSMVLP